MNPVHDDDDHGDDADDHVDRDSVDEHDDGDDGDDDEEDADDPVDNDAVDEPDDGEDDAEEEEEEDADDHVDHDSVDDHDDGDDGDDDDDDDDAHDDAYHEWRCIMCTGESGHQVHQRAQIKCTGEAVTYVEGLQGSTTDENISEEMHELHVTYKIIQRNQTKFTTQCNHQPIWGDHLQLSQKASKILARMAGLQLTVTSTQGW